MRIRDWSSDVCSSDLITHGCIAGGHARDAADRRGADRAVAEAAGPAMDRSRVDSRQQRGELARQGSDLAGKLRVAFARVRDFLILAAAYDLAARGGADVEIGVGGFPDHRGRRPDRSEEHTSELQSLMRISYAVFC